MSLGDRRLALEKAFERLLRRCEVRARALDAVLDPVLHHVQPVLHVAQSTRTTVARGARDLKAQVRARYVGDTGDLILALADRAILDAAGALIEAKKTMAVAIADEKRCAKRAEQEEANAAEWERRVRLAAEAGDDARVREALARKQEHLALAVPLREAWQAQRAAVEEQKVVLRRLNESVERAARAKNNLASQRKMNESRRRIDEAAATVEELSRALDLLISLDGLPGRSGEG